MGKVMNDELLRIVDAIRRDKNIDAENVFSAIEAAYLVAARRYYGEDEDIDVRIDRETGEIIAHHSGESIDPETLGRICAQSAKQIVIQKIREAERDSLYEEFVQDRGTVVTGIVQRIEGGALIVNIGKAEALLPRSETIPGENHRVSERIRAVILDVRKSGQRVKIILSRSHPDLVRRLFEQEVPEVAERIVEIRAISREAGYRTKLAVSSIDSKVDCVGACVGVRGSRIKNILDELGGEKIDIIRFNESLQVMIPNALAPAHVEDVQIYGRVGRAIVLVQEDQLSLAIGKRGQNVRLASKLCGLDIEIMTFEELTEEIDQAEEGLSTIPNITEEVVDRLIEEGILSLDDLSVMEPEQMMETTGLDEESVHAMIAYAEQAAEAFPRGSPKRSAILSSTSASAGPSAAEKLLGPDEAPPEESRKPTVEDLFGEETEVEPLEKPVTAQQLFGAESETGSREDAPAPPSYETSPVSELPDEP